MSAIDLRLMRIGIEVGGQLRTYDGLYFSASITKYANSLQNECQIKIANLTKAVRDRLITETSPFDRNRTAKRVVIEVGRISTGMSVIYTGDITESTPSQPPDIMLTLNARTGQFAKGQVIARSHGAQTSLQTIAAQIASDLGLSLQFEATNKNVGNFSFTGGKLKLVDALGDTAHVNAYVDDNKLIVKNYGVPLQNVTHELSKDTGLIGVPEGTEQGIKVRYLFDPKTKLGGRIKLKSEINPAMNGEYVIFKLTVDIANRDTPFYCVAECMRIGGRYPLYQY